MATAGAPPPSALLILDLANIEGAANAATQQMPNGGSLMLDLTAVRPFVEEKSGVAISEAVACTHWSPGREKYLGFLKAAGYDTVTRPMRTVTDSSGETRHLANVDAEVAAEAMLRSDVHDTIILGSGDQDFVPLVHSLRMRGKNVHLLSHSNHTSRQLIRAVGESRFIDIAENLDRLLIPAAHRHDLVPPAPPHPPVDSLAAAGRTGKCSVVIDSTGLSMATRHEGWQPDFLRMTDFVSQMVGPVADVTLVERHNPRREGFLNFLRNQQGWNVITKHPKTDGTCSPVVELSCAGISGAWQGNSVVFCSGNGNLTHVTRRLQREDCDVSILAPRASLSKALREAVPEHSLIDMSLHRDRLQREPRGLHRNVGRPRTIHCTPLLPEVGRSQQPLGLSQEH